MTETEARVGQKIRINPKRWDPVKHEWTFEENENEVLYNKVGTIRSVGVIPTVKVLANTNAGYWWYGVDYEEMERVADDTPLSIV